MTPYAETPELRDVLDRAKIGLLMTKNSVFLSTVLFSLKQCWTQAIPTAGVTPQLDLFINPDFFLGLSKDERIALLAHEAWHLALKHPMRCGQRDHDTYNRAADYVINLVLQKAGYTIPKGGLLDHRYEDMSTEDVYTILDKERQQGRPQTPLPMSDLLPGNGGTGGSGSGAGQGQNQGQQSGLTPEQLAAAERKVDDILVKANTRTRMMNSEPGHLPGELEVHLDKLLHPVIPWQALLQRYLQDLCKNDYSTRKFNKRYFPEHYLPSLSSTGLEQIAIAMDTSGSISDAQIQPFVSEMAFIKDTYQPAVLYLLDFDTKIKQVRELSPSDRVEDQQFSGRGGTRIGPVLDWARETQPKLLLVFTDGEFSFPPDCDPGIPVLWVIHSAQKFDPPFGEVVFFPLEEVKE